MGSLKDSSSIAASTARGSSFYPRSTVNGTSTAGGAGEVDHIQAATNAMAELDAVHSLGAEHWKRAREQERGVQVFVSKHKRIAHNEQAKASVYKGVRTIEGSPPEDVFNVIAQRDSWDDGLMESDLVDNLDDCTSLTYTVTKGIGPGTAPRDMSLVERVQRDDSGVIRFGATSVSTARVPRVSGRVRDVIALHGWVLEPVAGGGTLATYYLQQTHVKSKLPAFAVSRYLSRRPLCIGKVAAQLRKSGAPAAAATASEDGASSKRRRRRSSASERSAYSSRSALYPAHVLVHREAPSYADIEEAKRRYGELSASLPGGATSAVDHRGTKIEMAKDARQGSLPAVRGQALVKGATVEQVLGTIECAAARRLWDVRFAHESIVKLENGFDHGTFVESMRGIFPHIKPHHYVISRAVERSTNDGHLLLVSRSTQESQDAHGAPEGSMVGHCELSIWLLEPRAQGRDVALTHLAEVNAGGGEGLESVARRVLLSEIAQAPRNVADFIGEHGFAPYFMRWSAGSVRPSREALGDVSRGQVIYHFKRDRDQGKRHHPKQKCWLQYSDVMYAQGLDISLSPVSAASLAIVEDVDRTIEFVWHDETEDEIELTLKKATGEKGDVFVNGALLEERVGTKKPSVATEETSAAINGTATTVAVSKGAEGGEKEQAKDADEEPWPAPKPATPTRDVFALMRRKGLLSFTPGQSALIARFSSTHTRVSLPSGSAEVPTSLFVGNNFVRPNERDGHAALRVLNPSTSRELAAVDAAGASDVDDAVQHARRAFQSSWGRAATPSERARLLHKLADLMERDRRLLAELESVNSGKGVRMAREYDLGDSIACLRYYAGWADKITGDTIDVGGASQVYTQREPIGVCGQIIPWNYPILMWAWKVAPALAAGCTLVMKPSELTPLTALKLCELVVEADFPSGVVNTLPGLGAVAGAAIASHHAIDKVAFTGSVETGRRIMIAAAQSNLKKVTLELGGKSPAIVCPSADVEEAATWVAMGIFYNSGQDCTAGSRVLVHSSLHDHFVQAITARAEACMIGNPLDQRTSFGPLISAAQRDKVLSFVEDAVAAGATLATGGKLFDTEGANTDGFFVEPTVLTGVTNGMRVAREEIFGPVLAVLKYETEEEAIALANNSDFGLASSVYTNDARQALRLAGVLEAGTVWVNQNNLLRNQAPFGGRKTSGIGRELGKEGLLEYTTLKTVHHNVREEISWPL